MFHVNPDIKPKFDSLSTDLKNAIAERNIELNTLQDLIKVLEDITKEAENSH